MDQRMLLAVVLSIAVIFGYYLLFPPAPPEKQAPQAPPAQNAQQGGPADQRAEDAREEAGTSAALTQTAQPAQPLASAPQTPEQAARRRVEVDTPRYTALFDTRGARLVSLKLKRYKEGKAFINWGDIIPPLRRYLEKPELDPEATMEMVSNELSRVDPLDVEIAGEPKLSGELRRVNFSIDRERVNIPGEGGQAERLVFEGKTKGGLTLRKVLTFQPDSYVIGYELQVINYSQQTQLLRVVSLLGEGPDSGGGKGNIRSFYGPIFREDGSVDTEDPDDVGERLIVRSPQWVGITANYFITAVAPESRVDHAEFRSQKPTGARKDDSVVAYYGLELPAVRLRPGNMITGSSRLYFGPKQIQELERFGNGLEDSIQQTFDWLSPLAAVLLWILHWFYSYTGNYGVSIVLLTVVVRVTLFPLTYKGMVSMKRMSKLQPRMKAMREKYKDKKDKEKMNKEMMDLYKRHKINPLGGCLPILVQMPIFFALYSALLSAIELRHAPFMWWIADLSAMDPLYITPLLMGGTMFLQQRLTPTAMDPTQQKILMFMPLIFMVFMFSFPSGLVLYWLTSNILSIAQQLIINRVTVPELAEQQS